MPMPSSVFSFITEQACRHPENVALEHREDVTTYRALEAACIHFAGGYFLAGLDRGTRVGIYLPKCVEAVTASFGTLGCGGCMVPMHPALKSLQVNHILKDCGIELLVTTSHRLMALRDTLQHCDSLRHVVLTDTVPELPENLPPALRVDRWQSFCSKPGGPLAGDLPETGLAAIFYTSGSTGKPKGVVLNHRNLRMGAQSVAAYLGNTANDRILSVLPFSFDYGFSQLTTAFCVGATLVLHDYLLPTDVMKALEMNRITGLAAVPSLWQQLVRLEWPAKVQKTLRYITSSGDILPEATVRKLAKKLPGSDIYLMYGLTEAFRSTYLPPDEVLRRPASIGKAIPHAEIRIVHEDGSLCRPGEVGELVHRGPLVAQGYWNDPDKTAERFRPLHSGPGHVQDLNGREVWSGDLVRQDQDGYLYFVGRKDDMIKTSGYRISPAEIEEPAGMHHSVREAVAFGVAHPDRGQAVCLVYTTDQDSEKTEKELEGYLKTVLPFYMLPVRYLRMNEIPRNTHGKIDRKELSARYHSMCLPEPQHGHD